MKLLKLKSSGEIIYKIFRKYPPPNKQDNKSGNVDGKKKYK